MENRRINTLPHLLTFTQDFGERGHVHAMRLHIGFQMFSFGLKTPEFLGQSLKYGISQSFSQLSMTGSTGKGALSSVQQLPRHFLLSGK